MARAEGVRSTRPLVPRVLVAFDFDRTLAGDSIDAAAALHGFSRAEWEARFEAPLGPGWDEIIRRGQALIDMGRAAGRPLSAAVFAEVAGRLDLYPGVEEMPGRLRAAAEAVRPGTAVEVVVLSSGYAEIIEATAIARLVDRVIASSFHARSDGEVVCVRHVISHPAKALYLEALGKGVGLDGANAPERAGDPVDEHDRHVPFDQMIYVGDGASDLQAFGFLAAAGGLAIAVDPDRDRAFADAAAQTAAQRMDALVPPDYREGAALMTALEDAVRACAHRIALRGRDAGGGPRRLAAGREIA